MAPHGLIGGAIGAEFCGPFGNHGAPGGFISNGCVIFEMSGNDRARSAKSGGNGSQSESGRVDDVVVGNLVGFEVVVVLLVVVRFVVVVVVAFVVVVTFVVVVFVVVVVLLNLVVVGLAGVFGFVFLHFLTSLRIGIVSLHP